MPPEIFMQNLPIMRILKYIHFKLKIICFIGSFIFLIFYTSHYYCLSPYHLPKIVINGIRSYKDEWWIFFYAFKDTPLYLAINSQRGGVFEAVISLRKLSQSLENLILSLLITYTWGILVVEESASYKAGLLISFLFNSMHVL